MTLHWYDWALAGIAGLCVAASFGWAWWRAHEAEVIFPMPRAPDPAVLDDDLPHRITISKGDLPSTHAIMRDNWLEEDHKRLDDLLDAMKHDIPSIAHPDCLIGYTSFATMHKRLGALLVILGMVVGQEK